MTPTRALAVTFLVAGSTLGLAGPASADINGAYSFSGTYLVHLDGAAGVPTTWTAHSICAEAGGCVARISSSTRWSGDAALAGGVWSMKVDRTDGQHCPDGGRYSEVQTWSWDAATLTGEVSGTSTDAGACPEAPADSFELTRVR